MGNVIVDEYCRKFLEYTKYCLDEVTTVENNMMRFELGLFFEIQKHVNGIQFTILDEMYKRATEVDNIIRREKLRNQQTSAHSSEKRKKGFGGLGSSFGNNKKARGFSRFSRNGSENGGGNGSKGAALGNKEQEKDKVHHYKR